MSSVREAEDMTKGHVGPAIFFGDFSGPQRDYAACESVCQADPFADASVGDIAGIALDTVQ